MNRISIATLQLNTAIYEYGDNVELVLQERCAGCGQKYTWGSLAKIPLIGKFLHQWASNRHHKHCNYWTVIGISSIWEESTGAKKIVLFGRESTNSEERLHISWGFASLQDWPTEEAIRQAFDWPIQSCPGDFC